MESKEQFLRIAASRGLACPEQWFSRRPISEDLAWANVVITTFSTMAIEAAYADCLLIWLSFGPFRYEIREMLVENGYGRMARTKEDLSEMLAACRIPEQRVQLTDLFLVKARQLGIVNPGVASDIAKVMNTKQ